MLKIKESVVMVIAISLGHQKIQVALIIVKIQKHSFSGVN